MLYSGVFYKAIAKQIVNKFFRKGYQVEEVVLVTGSFIDLAGGK